jgi:hypothetical protein
MVWVWEHEEKAWSGFKLVIVDRWQRKPYPNPDQTTKLINEEFMKPTSRLPPPPLDLLLQPIPSKNFTPSKPAPWIDSDLNLTAKTVTVGVWIDSGSKFRRRCREESVGLGARLALCCLPRIQARMVLKLQRICFTLSFSFSHFRATEQSSINCCCHCNAFN